MTVLDLMEKIREQREDVLETGDHPELAKLLLAQLEAEADGIAPVFDEGALWAYSQATGLWLKAETAPQSRIVQSFSGMEVKGKTKPLAIKAADVFGVIKLAGHQAAQSSFFANARAGLAFANGFVEVTAEAIRILEHSPDHRARIGYGFAYDPSAKAPRFERFMSELYQGDDDGQQKIDLDQEFLGVSLLGLATRYQLALVLLGDGANGKSTLIIIVRPIFPDGSVVSIPPQDMGQEYRRALLAARLLNVVNELPEADIIDSESFKATITGDPTTGRHIREAPFSFSPIAGHVFAANRLPGTNDMTGGFWRRFVVVRFNRTFRGDAANPNLADEILATERAGIVKWMLEGARRVLRQGRYTIPSSHEKELAEWRRNANPVQLFFEEKTRALHDREKGEAASEMYSAYRSWSDANGFRAVSSTKFGERARLLGFGSESDGTARRHPRALRRPTDGTDSGLTGGPWGKSDGYSHG